MYSLLNKVHCSVCCMPLMCGEHHTDKTCLLCHFTQLGESVFKTFYQKVLGAIGVMDSNRRRNKKNKMNKKP